MKSFFLLSLVFFTLAWISIPLTLAESPKKPEDIILPEKIIQGEKGKTLPTGEFKTGIVPTAIRILLAVVGSVSVIVFVYAGVMLIISQGNEEEMTKFKNILLWSIIGLLFITTSYALVRGILQLVFK